MLILTTPEELRQYHPAHVLSTLDSYIGFIRSSQTQFLTPFVGKPLFNAVIAKYGSFYDKTELLADNEFTPWQELIYLCQGPVAFDMAYRAADVSAVSLNDSGLNIVETGGYEKADKEDKESYKKRMYKEAHAAIDRLLVTLEEWAEEVGATDLDDLSDEQQEKKAIVTLWRQSRYYYLAEGLFINTARKLNEFIDIYESREKFIQLLPDLRYCNEFVIRPELGDALTDDLIRKQQDGALSSVEAQAVHLAQYALALKVEDRSTLFKRPEAKDEAIGAMKRLIKFLSDNQSAFDEDIIKTAPFYKEPAPKPTEPPTPVDPWKNNRRGNKIFVTPAIE